MKYILPLVIITILLVSCNSSKKNPKDNAPIEQENSTGHDVAAIKQEENKNNAYKPDVIEIFKYDTVNIILEEYVDTSHYLPDNNTLLKLTNLSVFEYNYHIISSGNPSFNIHIVKIPENPETPFYETEGDRGGGYTKVSFYYHNDKIIMHLDHAQSDMTIFSEEELSGEVKKYRRPDEELIFDAIFVKE